MNKNIVRIQTELFKPGEKVRGHLIDIYTRPPNHCTWYPKQPQMKFVDDPEGVHAAYGHPGKMLVFEEGGLCFTFHALGAQVDGYTTGDIDFLMKEIPARTLFAEDLGHFADLATMSLNMFSNNAMWAVLAVYDVDVDNNHVEFSATLELDECHLRSCGDGAGRRGREAARRPKSSLTAALFSSIYKDRPSPSPKPVE